MTLLLKLLLAHLIGDFALQPKSWIADKQHKKHRSAKLYYHVAIHAILLIIVLGFDPSYWMGISLIVLSHLIIDIAKLNLSSKYGKPWLFFIDQGLHLLMILIAVSIYEPFPVHFNEIPLNKILLWAITLSVVTYVAAIVIMVMVSIWRPHTEDDKDDSLARAGRYIGMLERLFVFGFVITNHWEGIGFLLAAKSVFRFGDLKASKDRKLTEYILIGTLLSFGIAIFCGVVFNKLIETI